MKLVLLLIILLLNKTCKAQDWTLLQGKWKIVSVTEGQIYYDFATDSIFLPKEVLKEFFDEGHDSLFAVEMYKLKLGGLKNYLFSFGKDSVWLQSGTGKSKGTYQITSKRDSIDLFIPMSKEGHPQHVRYGYTIRDGVLDFTIPIDNYSLKLVLHKQ